MPEPKKTTTPPAAEQPAPGPVSSRLSAGESTDPDVHYLIANRRAHEMILEAETSTAGNKEHAESAIKDIDKQLAELGYG